MDSRQPGTFGGGDFSEGLDIARDIPPDPNLFSQVESLELKEVASAEDVPVMVHGTTYALWPVICKSTSHILLRTSKLTSLTPSQPRRASRR